MTRFAGDTELGYEAARHPLTGGLILDASYRLAHLPLVNPAHADVIPQQDGTGYHMGRYDRARVSLVAPVPYRHLQTSAPFNQALAALRASPLAAKIAWETFDQRQDRLHMTICGRLDSHRSDREIEGSVPIIKNHAAFRVRLGGPWIGAKNTGRIYLPVYPERTADGDALCLLQRSLSWPETRLYVVGLWNLTDHLNKEETRFLSRFIDRHRGEIFSEFLVDELHLAATHDDLALSQRIRNAIRLQPNPDG